MLGALACGGEAPERVPAPLPEGNGGSGQGPVVIIPPEGPECSTLSSTSQATSGAGRSLSVGIRLLGVTDPSAAFDGHVVARGVGSLPEGMTELPWGAASADDVGWLLLQETASVDAGTRLEETVSLDAGLQLQDASSVDAGSQQVDPSSSDAGAVADDGPRWTLVGPREIGEMPVPAGEALHVAMEEPRGGVYSPRHYEIVATQGERVVLFQQWTEYNNKKLRGPEGFRFEEGAIVCHRINKVGRGGAPCHYDYYHVLDVTVPGGASASLGMGESRTVGSYHVVHVATTSLSAPAISYQQIYGECSDIRTPMNSFTAILASDAP